MIADFFKPFFSGIFLESQLETLSRMFELIYKMFGEAYATIPKAGIEGISKQLFRYLKNTTFKFNKKVFLVKEGEINHDDNKKLESHFTIVATDPIQLIDNVKNHRTEW